ncbi:MAG: hypothetical protein GPJ54_22235 [Candidatus Heimdallarchaeota archaeon]|nr:hypothetical protein [Candidatus Heimdallarchaeota archaeon]
MFWRKKEKAVDYQLPQTDELEQWVSVLISSFNLKKGEFTFLPAYGGTILFVKDQGLSWLPYEEIRDIMGKMDKTQLAENTALVGGLAVATAAHVVLLPIVLLRVGLKGTYRTLVKPPPVVSVSILKSLIENVVIDREQGISKKILKTFEKNPYLSAEDEDDYVYRLSIERKFFTKYYDQKVSHKYVKGIKNFLTRSIDLEFIVPAQADVSTFIKILQSDGINVEVKYDENLEELKENQ